MFPSTLHASAGSGRLYPRRDLRDDDPGREAAMRAPDPCLSTSLPPSFPITKGAFLPPGPKPRSPSKLTPAAVLAFSLRLPSCRIFPRPPSTCLPPSQPPCPNSLSVLVHNRRQKTSPLHCDLTRTLVMPHSQWLQGHNEGTGQSHGSWDVERTSMKLMKTNLIQLTLFQGQVLARHWM